MDCSECGQRYPEPHLENGIAYFVCANCGNLREIENYEVYTPESSMTLFQNRYGLTLPAEYARFAGTRPRSVVMIPDSAAEPLRDYFGDGFYAIGGFAGLDPHESGSVFESERWVAEWGLPKNLVLIEGDGHHWLALDYRQSVRNPKVTLIESDEGNSVMIAETFADFVGMLIPNDRVYDPDGNLIYKG